MHFDRNCDYGLTDVPPQPNFPSDNVFNPGRPAKDLTLDLSRASEDDEMFHSVLGHGLENDEMFHSVSGSKPMPKYDLIIVANPEAVINTSNLVQHLERPGWLFKACCKSTEQPTNVEIILSEEPLSGKYDLIIVANAEANVNISNLLEHHLKRPGWLLKACYKSAKQPTDVEIILSEELLGGKYDLIIVANPEAVINISNLLKHYLK
ncbi:hypothetical protein BHE90_017300 [Fusarium euwallaceae]|uniref:Uncharacterized protein n=1 Tax=Fusarium euwallaceae TaxID=1147111 RepID=A0A430KXZ8_9HYPO|nr:hypothetical protein BHE90_017300 [Fusarium euwallaceae]